jgi:serine/threonine-protein kinase
MVSLLHRRLRIVTFLAFVPFLLFLVRNLVDPLFMDGVGLALHGLATAVLGVLAILLLPSWSWTESQLRWAELTLLGTAAVFFSWLQLGLFRNPSMFGFPDCETNLSVARLWIDSSVTRWFFLMVIYGVFIPNSWRRCAVVAGTLMLVPIALTLFGALATDHFCHRVQAGLFSMTVLLGTGVTTAVFGSYRLEWLQREAFQAQQLGQYRLTRRLGAGGMGEVYEAEHVLLRRRCAIKLILPDQTRDPAVLERFEREVQSMATLTHPNSVEVYDFGHADDGTFYYVMEFLPGLTLEQMVSQYGPLPPERAIHFLRQVCRALKEAHSIGLLHRDIKPSNIIACERGGEHDVAKLLDYGLVQTPALGEEAKRLTVQGMVLGSPPFMPPEQAAGRTDLDVRADIYSLGGVGYFLLTGRPPFPRETAMEMMLAHAYEAVPPPSSLRPGVPGDLEGVLLRCLSKKPEGRFRDVVDLEAALGACDVAGAWREANAAAWWKEQHRPPETATHEIPTMATPKTTGVM